MPFGRRRHQTARRAAAPATGRRSPVPRSTTPPRDGRNCIEGDTGNDGPGIYAGLVTGRARPLGRLDVRRRDADDLPGPPT